MAYDNILLSRDDGIITLTLNRPESRNAMSPAMGEEIVRAVEEIRADRAARVVVITGAGRAFSSGGDLAMLARDAGLSDDDGPRMAGSPVDFYSRYLSIRRLEVPTIAAINGHAIGAGLCFALAADLRIAAREAKMGMTFTRLGLHPGMGATYFLPRLIGTARAAELLFSGRIIDADEALHFGMLNRVVAGDQLGAATQALAAEIAAAGPIAVRMTKRALYRGTGHSLEEMLELEALQQGITFATEDVREGIRAVMEKRAPEFRNR